MRRVGTVTFEGSAYRGLCLDGITSEAVAWRCRSDQPTQRWQFQ